MSKLLLLPALLLVLTACSKSVEVRTVCVKYPFVILSKVEPVALRVHKEDEQRYVAYINALRLKSSEYERQITDYSDRWCNDSHK